MLPFNYTSQKNNPRWLERQKIKYAWCCYEKDDSDNVSCDSDTEADARAKMLIYLLENKLITL